MWKARWGQHDGGSGKWGVVGQWEWVAWMGKRAGQGGFEKGNRGMQQDRYEGGWRGFRRWKSSWIRKGEREADVVLRD